MSAPYMPSTGQSGKKYPREKYDLGPPVQVCTLLHGK